LIKDKKGVRWSFSQADSGGLLKPAFHVQISDVSPFLIMACAKKIIRFLSTPVLLR
jgi:hypothetical protein